MRSAIAFAIVVSTAASLACCIPGRQEQPQQNAKAPPAPEPAPTQENNPGDAPSIPQKAKDGPAAPAPEKIVWAAAPKESATIGDLHVTVTGARIGKARLKTTFSKTESLQNEPHLIVYLHLKNLSETKKIDHAGWSDSVLVNATLKDEFGNRYHQGPRVLGIKSVDGVKAPAGDIYPGKDATDVVLFQIPVDKTTTLKLELSAPAPISGTFRFEIPMSIVARDP